MTQRKSHNISRRFMFGFEQPCRVCWACRHSFGWGNVSIFAQDKFPTGRRKFGLCSNREIWLNIPGGLAEMGRRGNLWTNARTWQAKHKHDHEVIFKLFRQDSVHFVTIPSTLTVFPRKGDSSSRGEMRWKPNLTEDLDKKTILDSPKQNKRGIPSSQGNVYIADTSVLWVQQCDNIFHRFLQSN